MVLRCWTWSRLPSLQVQEKLPTVLTHTCFLICLIFTFSFEMVDFVNLQLQHLAITINYSSLFIIRTCWQPPMCIDLAITIHQSSCFIHVGNPRSPPRTRSCPRKSGWSRGSNGSRTSSWGSTIRFKIYKLGWSRDLTASKNQVDPNQDCMLNHGVMAES